VQSPSALNALGSARIAGAGSITLQGALDFTLGSANCNIFQLEATYSLSSNTNSNPAIWTPVTGNPVLIGGQWIVSVPIEATTNRFFRLRLP